MSRQRYPEEFKIEAVKQVTEKGKPVAEVAQRLGMVNEAKDVQRPCYRRDADGRLATQATAASDDSLRPRQSVQ